MGIKLFLIHHQQHRRFLAYLQNLTKRYPYLFVLDYSTLIVCLRVIIFFFKKRFYLFIHESHGERGRDTGRGEAGFMQGAWCGTQSQDPGIMTWAKGRCSATPNSLFSFFFFLNIIYVKRSCLGIGLGSVSLSIVTITLHCCIAGENVVFIAHASGVIWGLV